MAVLNAITLLKKAIIVRFDKQLLLLQKGHPYKRNRLIQEAIDLVEYLETCTPSRNYTALINSMINRLYSDYNNTNS